jgi:hypothetical protein
MNDGQNFSSNALAPAQNEAARRFEFRPSPFAKLNDSAPDEIVYPDGDGPTFNDFLKSFNPLQHLPVIGTIYRAVTGDTIEPAAGVIGGLLFGGPISAATSLFNSIVGESSGKDVGGHMMAMVGLGKDSAIQRPTAPPRIDSANVPLLASASDGGMLQSWISGGEAFAQNTPERSVSPIPTQTLASAPAPTPAPVQPPARPQTNAAPGETGPIGGMFEPVSTGARGRSLDAYRQSAVVSLGAAARTPSPLEQLGFNRQAETARQSMLNATSRTQPAGTPATLAAQELASTAKSSEDADSYFAAAMAAGLDRYKQMQRQRDAGAGLAPRI